jgi:hypothetical protein
MLVVSAASMAFHAYGSYQTAQADKAAMKYEESVQRNNAQIAENNAKLQEQAAADTEQRGKTEAANHMRQVQAMKGKQQTAMAANGLALNEGSALSLLEDTQFMGEYDAETIKSNAGRDAWGQRVGAMNSQAESNNLKTSASFSKMKGKQIKPGMSALTSAAGSVASNWGGASGIGANAKSAWGSGKLWSSSV